GLFGGGVDVEATLEHEHGGRAVGALQICFIGIAEACVARVGQDRRHVRVLRYGGVGGGARAWVRHGRYEVAIPQGVVQQPRQIVEGGGPVGDVEVVSARR